MPYREQLLERANLSWYSTAERYPDLTPAIELQRLVISRQLDLVDELGGRNPTRIDLSPDRVSEKLRSEMPVFLNETVVINMDLTPFVVGFCRDLAHGEAAGAGHRLADLLSEGAIDVDSLIAASIGRRQGAIRTKANHIGISADLMWLVAELAAGSLAHRAQRDLLSGHDDVNDALSVWPLGCCPACGSWPAYIEHLVGDDTAVYRCSFCGCSWSPSRTGCAYCNDAPDPLMTAVANDAQPDRRVDLCRNCACYLKHLDRNSPTPFELLAVEDLCSSDLDVAAAAKGYRRPGMRDFQS